MLDHARIRQITHAFALGQLTEDELHCLLFDELNYESDLRRKHLTDCIRRQSDQIASLAYQRDEMLSVNHLICGSVKKIFAILREFSDDSIAYAELEESITGIEEIMDEIHQTKHYEEA
jgi:hypothetical protein